MLAELLTPLTTELRFDTLDFKTKATDGATLASDPQFGTFSPKTFQISTFSTFSLPTKTQDPYSSGSFGGQHLLCQKDSHGCFWNKISWFFFFSQHREYLHYIFLVYWGYASQCPVIDNCDFSLAARTYAEYNYGSDQMKLGKCSKGTMESLSAGAPGSKRRQRRLHHSLDCLLIKQKGIGLSDNFSSCFHHLDYRERKKPTIH